MSVRTAIGLSIVLCLTVACERSHAQLRDPSTTPHPSIWSYVGVPQAAHGVVKVKDAVANRCGKLPCLERKPALKALADPANPESDIPASKAAVEIKAAENLKPRKIKAVRYLAKMGCGCYDKDGKVTAGLLAAMEDCTEDVRRAAIEAIGDATRSECCEYCKQPSCCNEKVTEKLAKIAYEQGETGCYLESSERVRRAAMEALVICCPSWDPIEEPQPDEPGIEEPEDPSEIEGAEPEEAGQSDQQANASQIPRHLAELFENATIGSSISDKPKPLRNDGEQPEAVVQVNHERKEASVRFLAEGVTAEPGARLKVYQPEKEGYSLLGELEVVEIVDGAASVQPVGDLDLSQLVRGAVLVVP